MSGCGWCQKTVGALKVGLAGLSVGLNLLPALAIAETSVAKPSVEQNGVHLYGEANTAHQLGKGYLIFEQSGAQIVGAMYSPQSEYTCFTGKRAATQVDLQPFEPGQPLPDQETVQISLSGLHSIAPISPSERQVLAACQREASLLQSSRTVTVLPRPW